MFSETFIFNDVFMNNRYIYGNEVGLPPIAKNFLKLEYLMDLSLLFLG